MKHLIKKLLNTSNLFVLMIGAAIVTISACATKVDFQTSSVVPAARGSVKVKKDDNQNYLITVDLFNLAEGKRLPSNEQTYVVWMEGSDQAVKNLGQINSSTKMISKRLKASFEGVSSIKPAKIFITAENNSAVQYPGNELILTTNRF